MWKGCEFVNFVNNVLISEKRVIPKVDRHLYYYWKDIKTLEPEAVLQF